MIPPCLWLVFLLQRRWWKEANWSGVVDPHLLRILLKRDGIIRTSWFPWLLSLVSILILTALAGPAWEKNERPVFRKKILRVVVLDVSISMFVFGTRKQMGWLQERAFIFAKI